MESASISFIFFGLAVALLSNLSRSPGWRAAVLFLASLAFLGVISHDPIVWIPLAGFLLFGYAALLWVGRQKGRGLGWAVIAVILAYFWLKKYTFLPAASFLSISYLTLGLSYIFFRVLHLIIEAGEQTRQPIGLGAYLLYLINFTTFVSGPVQRYEEFARDQFAAEPLALDIPTIARQLERIVYGLFKVNVLALLLSWLQQDALADLGHPLPTPALLWAGFRLALVYPFFLYANFSGYIDIVIALARLMRLELPENFDRPFSSTSFLEFWNRWHITVSTWLKTYVYNPLLTALMRRFPSPAAAPGLAVLSFFVTFFLVGLWHGRTSEFLFFGVLQGGGVAFVKLWQVLLTGLLGRKQYKALAANAFYTGLARGLTLSWFAFTLFWFWASWQQIGAMAAALGYGRWILVWAGVGLAASILLAAYEGARGLALRLRTSEGPLLASRYARMVYVTVLGVLVLVVQVLLNQQAPDIVYKAF